MPSISKHGVGAKQPPTVQLVILKTLGQKGVSKLFEGRRRKGVFDQ